MPANLQIEAFVSSNNVLHTAVSSTNTVVVRRADVANAEEFDSSVHTVIITGQTGSGASCKWTCTIQQVGPNAREATLSCTTSNQFSLLVRLSLRLWAWFRRLFGWRSDSGTVSGQVINTNLPQPRPPRPIIENLDVLFET